MQHEMNFFSSHHHSFTVLMMYCVMYYFVERRYELLCAQNGRILVWGRATDTNFQWLVIDHVISNDGDILTGYFPGSVSSVIDHFKLSRSCVAKLRNSACEGATTDPQWKGANNPTHLHSQDLNLLEALKSACHLHCMPYNKICEGINANCTCTIHPLWKINFCNRSSRLKKTFWWVMDMEVNVNL